MNTRRMLTAFILISACLFTAACGSSPEAQAKAQESMAAEDPLVTETRDTRKQLRETIEQAKQQLPDEAAERIDAAKTGTEVTAPVSDSTTVSVAADNDTAATSYTDAQQALVDSERLTFYTSVPGAPADTWKMGIYYSDKSQADIALDYYNAFFSDDSEIHALINPQNKTTACITDMDGTLDVAVYEYIDNEETDASLMFSGVLYDEYKIDTATGEVEKIQ